MTRTIVVGVGNPILGDDGVGIIVVQELRKKLKDPEIVIEEAYTGGLNLLDIIMGYDHAILVDAISVPDKRPGEVFVLDPKEVPSTHSTNPHNVSFGEAIDMVERMRDQTIPAKIELIGINIKPSLDFSDRLSIEVEEAVPKAVAKVEGLLKDPF
jgi:hydrogenase maturation protease